MTQKFGNYSSTSLTVGISAVATTMIVNSSASFPTLSTGDYFYATIIDQVSAVNRTSPPTQREVVRVTAIAGTTWTVVRAQDGTTGQVFSAGAVVELRVANKTLVDINPIELNVKAYGAVGNGVADDTTAIVNCIAAANAAQCGVYLPAGTYLTNPITLLANVAYIRGDGPGETIIFPTRQVYGANTPMINLSASTKRAVLSDLVLDLQNANFDNTWGILLSADGVAVKNVNITGRCAIGAMTRAGTGCSIDGMVLTGSGGAGINVGVYADTTSSEFQVRDVSHSGLHAYTVNISSGAFNVIERCKSYAMTAIGVFAFTLSGCTLSNIINCYSRDSYHEAANITNCTYCGIIGCHFEWTGVNGIDFGISVAGSVAGGGGQYNVVANNVIQNSYSAALCVGLNASNNLFANNVAHDCGYRAGVNSALMLAYTGAVGEINGFNRFSDNVCITTSGTATYGVRESQFAGSTINNNIYDRNTMVGITNRYSSFANSATVIDHEWQTFVPTITNTGGGGFTTSVQSARYQLNGKRCSGVLVFTVTNAGGGGYINITLPFTGVSANAGVAVGMETVVAGLSVGGSIGLTSINSLRTYNNTATAVLNYKFYINFDYEMA